MLPGSALATAVARVSRRGALLRAVARPLSFSFPPVGPFDRLRSKPLMPPPAEDEEEDDEFLDSGDPDPRYRLGRHLMKMTRVPYRTPLPLPDWVQSRKDEISGRRTPAQVRRCLKDWMLKSNREEQKKFLFRPLKWYNTMPKKAMDVYPYGAEETIAYSNYFFPGRYAVLRRLLVDLKTMLPDFAPSRIVDFGCGPATGAAVAVEVFGREGVHKYAGVDMSQSMQDAAQIMTRNLGIDCHFWSKTSDLVKRALNDDSERFDLAICSYTLVELANDPARRAAVQILFELLDCGGVVIFLEKGNPEGSFAVRTARQLLLSMNDPSVFLTDHKKRPSGKGGFPPEEAEVERPQYVLRAPVGMTHMETDVRTLAPCTHDKPCPLADSYYCSFSQKTFGSMIHNQQAEKFSYVMMQKRKRSVFVKEKQEDGSQTVKSLQAFAETRKRGKKEADIEVESRLHSKRAGGVWLDAAAESEFPTPLTVLRRFQALGRDAERPLHIDEDEDEDGLYEGDLEGRAVQLENAPGRRGGRRARAVPVRLPDADDDEYDDDDEPDTLRFRKPRTKVDVLVDELIDEIDWEEYNPPLHRHEWGRILRTPIKNKGHIIMDLCMPNGEIVRSTFAKSNIQPVPQLYKALRKTSWGGLFPVGAGHEDGHSVLTKSPKKPLTGMSASRVQKRRERETELLERASNQTPKSAQLEERADRPVIRKRGAGLANVVDVPKKKEPIAELVVPGKDVPFHSTFLRSKEFVYKDEIAQMQKEKELAKEQKVESKRRSISKMSEAFRQRQAARRAAGEGSSGEA